MEYRIETKPAFNLTGVSIRTSTKEGQCFQEIPALWERSMQDGSFAKPQALVPPGSAVGVAGVCAESDLKNQEFSYFIAVETPTDRSGLPAGSRDLPVPASSWGVFESHGPIREAIQGVMQRIFGEWFPSSRWEHADAPELEIYSAGDIRDPNYYGEIWMPLRKPPN